MTEKTHYNNFNIIRFAAALMVIYGHMCYLSGTPIFLLGSELIHAVGVKILFVISGFLITKSYLADPHFLRYMTKRCFRIFPALFGLVFLTVFILGPVFTSLTVGEYFQNYYTWQYLKNLIFYPIYKLPGVFAENVYPGTINGALWTLPIEFAMYLLLPVFIVVFRKMNRIQSGMFITGLLLLTVEILRNLYFRDMVWVVWGSNLPDALALLPYFFIGSSLSQVKKQTFFNLQVALALLIFLLSFSFSYTVFNLLLFLVLPYTVITFATIESPIFGRFLPKTDVTYGLYLYGFPVQQIVSCLLMPYHLPINLLFVISTCFALGFAFLSWYFIEKPLQKVSRHLLAKL